MQAGGILRHFQTFHNCKPTRSQLTENTTIISQANNRFNLAIREAILIIQKTPSINIQFDNFSNILKLYKSRNITSNSQNNSINTQPPTSNHSPPTINTDSRSNNTPLTPIQSEQPHHDNSFPTPIQIENPSPIILPPTPTLTHNISPQISNRINSLLSNVRNSYTHQPVTPPDRRTPVLRRLRPRKTQLINSITQH